MIPNSADRKDIAQDVYLKVYASLPKFRFQSKLSTYIGQVTYNTCLHYLEKKRLVLLQGFAVNGDTDTELDQLMLNAGLPPGNEAETRLFSKDLETILQAALLELPILYQTIIGLYHQQEMPLSEIAEITSLPVGTVKSYLFRARKQLKDILLKNYKKEEL